MKYYRIPIRFTGRVFYNVAANSEQEAMEKANEFANEDVDCGDLTNIDFITMPPVEIWHEGE